jgi:2-polyprenyl-6-hydroxyphenyl methylase / 3-demethylubiquinone-9 3-methyltransferase
MENYRAFYESVGERYPEEESVYRTLSGRLRREFVLSRIRTWKGRFLDVGCNRGGYLTAYTGGAGIGVDLSLAVLRRLRARAPGQALAVADAQSLGCFRPDSFDGVLCSEVLEHVPDPAAVFAGIRRVLRKGGKVLVTTPNHRGRKPGWVDCGVLRRYGVAGVRGDSYYHTAFRPEELAVLAEKADLRILETGTLEHEVRYAAKAPAGLYVCIEALNRRWFRSVRIETRNRMMYERFTLGVHRAALALGFDAALKRFIREGVRSYLLASRP